MKAAAGQAGACPALPCLAWMTHQYTCAKAITAHSGHDDLGACLFGACYGSPAWSMKMQYKESTTTPSGLRGCCMLRSCTGAAMGPLCLHGLPRPCCADGPLFVSKHNVVQPAPALSLSQSVFLVTRGCECAACFVACCGVLCCAVLCQVVGSSYQALEAPNNATYIGSGKVAEVAAAVAALKVTRLAGPA